MRDIWRKIVLTSGAQGYSLVIGIVILTLTARWLGPEGRGTIAAVTTWVSLFSTIGYLSMGQVAIYRATAMRAQVWLPDTLGSLIVLDVLITGLGWALAALMFVFTGGAAFNSLPPLFLLVGFLALPLMIWEQYGSSLLMAVDQVMLYSRAQVVGRTAGLIVILLAWLLNGGIAAVLGATLLSQSIVSLAGIRFLFKRAEQPVRPQRATMLALLKGGLKLHLNYVGSFLISSASILIINNDLGPVETSYYQVAAQLIAVLFVVPQAASMVIYSRVTAQGPDAAWREQRRLVLVIMGLMIAIAVIAAALAPILIPLVLGEKFAPAVPLFQLMLLAVLGMALASIMNPQWIGRGLFSQISMITLGMGIVSCISNLLLVPRFGTIAAVWTLIGIYGIAAAVQLGMALYCEWRQRHGVMVSNPA